MFLDHILRPAEVKEFEGTLKPHQLARIAISSNDQLASAISDDGPTSANEPNTSTRTGPSTVLDRAVMEHNLLASSNIYNNITFRGLGALLDLTPGAAETMARKMIEQGRLRGSIDQVDKLIWFEERDEDDAQGKAGGLGDVEQVTEDTGAPFTKRWDNQIRMTAANVGDGLCQLVSHQLTSDSGGIYSTASDREGSGQSGSVTLESRCCKLDVYERPYYVATADCNNYGILVSVFLRFLALSRLVSNSCHSPSRVARLQRILLELVWI